MFGKKKKEKRPENVKSIYGGGYGLWMIWYDNGPQTQARAVSYPRATSGVLSAITGGHVFLYDNEALDAAIKLAEHHPDKRFCVKKHYA